MKLTRRGGATLAAAVAAVVLGALYGARALNAVAAPALVALLAGAVQVWRADQPTVTRRELVPGFPGETRTVRLDVETDGPCTVRDETDPGLHAVFDAIDALGGQPETALAGSGRVEYDVEFRERGEHYLGPATVTVRDVLGLVAREFQPPELTPVLVYPEVRPVSAHRTFAGLVEQAGTPEREAFDRLREYTPGDALRDIDWKSSAKHAAEEFVVTEYAAADEGTLTLVAEAEDGYVDEAAAAAASVALYLLDARLNVEVVVPTGRIEAGTGDEQRQRVLAGLARTRAGSVGASERERADVYVTADVQGAYVRIGDREVPFDQLADPAPAQQEVVAA